MVIVGATHSNHPFSSTSSQLFCIAKICHSRETMIDHLIDQVDPECTLLAFKSFASLICKAESFDMHFSLSKQACAREPRDEGCGDMPSSPDDAVLDFVTGRCYHSQKECCSESSADSVELPHSSYSYWSTLTLRVRSRHRCWSAKLVLIENLNHVKKDR